MGLEFLIPLGLADVFQLTVERRFETRRWGHVVQGEVTRHSIPPGRYVRLRLTLSMTFLPETNHGAVLGMLEREVSNLVLIAARLCRAEDWDTPVYISFWNLSSWEQTILKPIGTRFVKLPAGLAGVWYSVASEEDALWESDRELLPLVL